MVDVSGGADFCCAVLHRLAERRNWCRRCEAADIGEPVSGLSELADRVCTHDSDTCGTNDMVMGQEQNGEMPNTVCSGDHCWRNGYGIARLFVCAVRRGDYMTNDYLKHRSKVAKLTNRLVLCRYPDISEKEKRVWFLAGYLHDIGKEVIYRRHPRLLKKPDPLTEEEWNIIRTHTQTGFDMLKGSQRKEISFAAIAALEHHERWDGSGYMGKADLGISLQGRVVAVADVFSALCQERSY